MKQYLVFATGLWGHNNQGTQGEEVIFLNNVRNIKNNNGEAVFTMMDGSLFKPGGCSFHDTLGMLEYGEK